MKPKASASNTMKARFRKLFQNSILSKLLKLIQKQEEEILGPKLSAAHFKHLSDRFSLIGAFDMMMNFCDAGKQLAHISPDASKTPSEQQRSLMMLRVYLNAIVSSAATAEKVIQGMENAILEDSTKEEVAALVPAPETPEFRLVAEGEENDSEEYVQKIDDKTMIEIMENFQRESRAKGYKPS